MQSAAPQSSTPLPVAIQRYFEVALFLLVFTGFASLAGTGGLDLPTVFLVSAALVLRGYLLATRRSFVIHERWTTWLTLAYVAFYLADYFLLSGSFLNATVHLVLFVMAVRLFSAQRDRDYYFLAIISFLMVLAAAVLTVNSTFLLAFVAFLLMAVVTFILMEMRRSSVAATLQAKASSDPLAPRRMAWSLAAASPLLAGLILAGASVIFFVLPRISAGYLSAYAPSSELTSGFSDRVQLGQIGRIQQSSSVVMHIQIDDDQRGRYDVKWRGIALSRFDGKSWSNPHEQVVVPRAVAGRFVLWQPDPKWEALLEAPPLRAVQTIHYRVLMEPIGANIFFLAARPHSLEGDYRLISMDRGGAVYDLDPEHLVGRYEASSNIAQPRADELRAAASSYPPEISRGYLQLPTQLDRRIPRLAEQVTASNANNYDKAAALEQYLRTNFGYTLQLSRTPPPDPLAEFLFERKQGHCEYFASAMAVMLRTLGIPARIVNGFRTGEFNDLTAEYIVRAANAHSWVEAYFPDYGWVSFDPTPGGMLEGRAGWSRLALYMDAVASFWREWVINYDVGHQQTLAQQTTRTGRQLVEQALASGRRRYAALLAAARHAQQSVASSPRRWGFVGSLIASMLLLLINLRRLGRLVRLRRLVKHPEDSPRLAATVWYERMTRRVARRGWRKSPAQTPAEFLAAIQDPQLRSSVAQFTRHYESARFGDSAEDARRLPELYVEITTTARR
jgi:transglutaminase-like putative cysteine protease